MLRQLPNNGYLGNRVAVTKGASTSFVDIQGFDGQGSSGLQLT